MPAQRELTVQVNNKDVTFTDHRRTGAEIKETAIAQGVEIDRDFQLSMKQGNGVFKVIGDEDVVTLTPATTFRAVGPDDNS